MTTNNPHNGPVGPSTITLPSFPSNFPANGITVLSNGWAIGPMFQKPIEDAIIEEEYYGHNCKKCKEYYEHAQSNQTDGTLICWACRHGF